MSKKLKIGFVIEYFSISKSTKDLLNMIQNDAENFEIPIIINQNKKKQKFVPSFFKRIVRKVKGEGVLSILQPILIRIIVFLEMQLLKKKKYYNLFRLFNVDPKFSIIEVFPELSSSGFICRYNKKDIETIKKEKFDILINCNSEILKGDILNIPLFGRKKKVRLTAKGSGLFQTHVDNPLKK